MPARVAFLSSDEVLAIHAQLTATFGGADGLRDAGLLDNAHGFLIGLLEMHQCEFARLLPWIRDHLNRL